MTILYSFLGVFGIATAYAALVGIVNFFHRRRGH